MKKTILTFGLISGAISGGMFFLSMPFHEQLGYGGSEILGYTTIVLSFLMVFFGVRSYRDNVAGGNITFGTGFKVGILITLISCAVYVLAWEIYYFGFSDHTMMQKYADAMISQMKQEGATVEMIEEKAKEMQGWKENFENPIYNSAMTFMEPFPVGLILTLLSAAILRKKPQTTTV